MNNDRDNHGRPKEDYIYLFYFRVLDLLSPVGVKPLRMKGSSQSTLEKMKSEERHERDDLLLLFFL